MAGREWEVGDLVENTSLHPDCVVMETMIGSRALTNGGAVYYQLVGASMEVLTQAAWEQRGWKLRGSDR